MLSSLCLTSSNRSEYIQKWSWRANTKMEPEAAKEEKMPFGEGGEEKKIEGVDPDEHFISKQVRSIVFSMLSPKMIKKMASAKVVTPELYDKEGYPVDGGLMDIRLGVIDPGLRCKT